MTNVVTFPGLGLEFTLNRVAFSIFGFSIYWYGLIIVSGLLLAVFLCSKWSGRFGVTKDQILDLMLFAVPAALVALRAYYVVFNLDLYRRADGTLDWLAIFSFRDGGLAIYGAIISSAIVLMIFCRRRKISFLAYADLGVHGLFIGQIIGRWGNFMNVEAFGGITAAPWRMCSQSIADYLLVHGYADQTQYQAVLSGELGVHPTFFYESAWNLVGLVLVYLIGKKRKFDGQCFLFYVFWYGLGRFWIEGMRTDSLYLFGLELFGAPVRVSQLLALVSALIAGALLVWMWRRPHDPKDMFVNRAAAAQAEADGAARAPEAGKEDEENVSDCDGRESSGGEGQE